MSEIYYDEDAGALALGSTTCPDCDAPMYDTGCDAPGCRGWQCADCGTGCDQGYPGSRCDAAIAGEGDEEYAARVNAGRAAFGLGPAPEA